MDVGTVLIGQHLLTEVIEDLRIKHFLYLDRKWYVTSVPFLISIQLIHHVVRA